MKTIITIFLLTFFTVSSVNAAFPTAGSSQTPYCMLPPSIGVNAKPNIDFVVDFTGSMNEEAYPGVYAGGASGTNKNYYGYFKTTLYYKYNTTSGYFEENSACTNTDSVGTASSSCISGNLLNWIAMTRMDVVRKILTGGRVKSGYTDVRETEGYGLTYTFSSSSAYTALKNCKFTVSPAGASTNRLLTVADVSTSQKCTGFGTFTNYNLDVKTSTPADITGIIQSLYPTGADIELAIYQSSYPNSIYRVGKNKTVANYVDAINNEPAGGNTNTGPALEEARRYFKQDSLEPMTNAANKTLLFGNGDYTKDPYYDLINSVSEPVPCRKSYVLLISDGEWNTGIDPVGPAHSMNKNDLRSDLLDKQNVQTYTVYAFGSGTGGRNAMITTALFGGYDDNDANGWPYPFTAQPSNSTTVSYPLASCNPIGTWNSSCGEWDKEKSGLPPNFYEASDGDALQAAISNAILAITAKTASGTAASVSGNDTSSEGMLARAVYFPKKEFDASTVTTWAGEMDSLWLYVSPLLTYVNVREDSVQDNKLSLLDDKIVKYNFSGAALSIDTYTDSNGDGGSVETSSGTLLTLESVKSLWKAGKQLWSRSPSNRLIYTNDPTVTTYQGSLINFDVSNHATLRDYLDVGTDSAYADTDNVINYIRGVDLTGYRSRTVKISSVDNVWKLADNINSTPQILANSVLNDYYEVYRDTTYNDYIGTSTYKNRGVILFGANDGMLHSFSTGKIVAGARNSFLKNADGSDIVATAPVGEEQWAFVPKHALPYLKHFGNPNYSHIFYVDATTSLLDASIGITKRATGPSTVDTCTSSTYYECPRLTTVTSNMADISESVSAIPTTTGDTRGTSWRTLLLGSMGLGGATRAATATCTNCIKAPALVGANPIGYSSVFALDLTEPVTPKLLWEFADPAMGLSISGPAVLRIKAPSEKTVGGIGTRNGKWYAVLASGPTGPIDTGIALMKGYSDQPLTVFVLDLRSGEPVRTFSAAAGPVITGVPHTQVTSMPVNAFAGRLTTGTLDTERINKTTLGYAGAYSDDALYFGYTRKDVTAGSPSLNKFSKGGVLRLLTGNDPDPANWTISPVMDGIGPVVGSVVKFQPSTINEPLWLFWGTGRYFYKSGANIDEDYTGMQEAIYGVTEPCYNVATQGIPSASCSTIVLASSLTDQTSVVSSTVSSYGYKINLAKAAGDYKAQRVISDSLSSTSGTVFFTAFKPSTKICGYGGDSSLWAINYSNGGAPEGVIGKVILQTSVGAMKFVDVKTDLTNSLKRESSTIAGVPPGSASPQFTNSNHHPVKKILSIQER